MTYQCALNYNNTAGYANIAPSPVCKGIQYAYEDTPLGSVQISNGYAELYFSILTPVEYVALLTTFGLSAASRKEITITLPLNDRTMGNFNAIVNLPRQLQYQGFYKDVMFPLFSVEEI